MVGGGKPSGFVHCHPGSVVSIFTCESSLLLYTFVVNIVAVTVGFVISLLSPVNALTSSCDPCLLCLVSLAFSWEY